MDGEKWCPKCHEFKALDLYSIDRSRRDGRKSWCKVCDGARARLRYQRSEAVRARAHQNYLNTLPSVLVERRDRYEGKNRAKRRAYRLEALRVYGGKCVDCGTTERLQFDHVNNDGAAHRRVERERDMIARIARQGTPLDDWALELRCPDCHRKRTLDVWRPRPAVCPHCGKGI